LCDVLLRADDIVHDDNAPVKAQIVRKAFRGSEFLYTLKLRTGETVMAHVPSHHNHALGEWIGIRAEVDHVVTFPRARPAYSPVLSLLPQALNVFTQRLRPDAPGLPLRRLRLAKTTTALSGGAVSVRQIEPTRVSSST
jgi:hypothetical protein